MTYFTKRYHPPGTSPGTLIKRDKLQQTPLRILLTDYTDSDYSEQELTRPEECAVYLQRDTVTWIHVQGHAEPDTLRGLGEAFGLHQLALEDVINAGQRPKVDDYKDQLFVVMSHPVIDAGDANVKMDQLSLFIGHNFVISFHPGENDPFTLVRKRLSDHVGRIRGRGADYLLYALIDVVIDEGFPVLERLGDEVEALEEELLDTPSKTSLRRLHQLKRTLVILRRMLWPQRDVLNSLVRGDSGLIADENMVYYRDCYDHTIQILDLIETYRDMATGLLDIYLSSTSYRLNEIMRVLTMIATIFIPLTFVVGVYGMNFGNEHSPWAMPELRWYYGYPLVWLVMILIIAGMLVYFRRKKWL
jgi:magnesium transporter